MKVKYDLIELKTIEDLKFMRKTYHCRLIKGVVEFDVRVFRSLDDIIKILKCLELSSSV